MPCLAATFGTVVPHAQPLADLVIDEARKRLYVVNTYSSTVEVYATNVSPPRLTNTIKTDATPLSMALSRETPTPRYLYVACYDGSTLDIIDLNSANFSYGLQATGRQTAGRGRRLQRQGPGQHRRHRHGRRGAGHLRSRTRNNPSPVRGSPSAGGPRAAPAQRHHVSRRKEPPAGIAGRQTHHRRQFAGRHPHRLRVRCGVVHRAQQSRRARNFAHPRGIAGRQQVPQRAHALRYPDAGRAGAAEHHQLAVRLPR